MMMLPNGQVLFTGETGEVYAYSYFSCPATSWRPRIVSAPSNVLAGFSYSLNGEQLNGLSQTVGYGDDSTAPTNYPLVRIRNIASGNVRYCRTFGHSTMGVNTGTTLQSTNFRVPFNIEKGPSELCVVANGISSTCVPVNVEKLLIDGWQWEIWAHLIGSLADGPLWVLGPHGPIPVDPWGPKVTERAAKIWKSLKNNLAELETLGLEVNNLRLEKAAKQTGPVIIEDGEEYEKEERSISTKQSETKKKKG